MASRTDPNLTDQVTALLCLYLQIPHDVAKEMSRESIQKLVQWDHWPVPVAIAKDLGWTPDQYNHPSNLVPVFAEDHAVKTAKRDIPQIAKSERINAAHAEFRRKLLARVGQGEEPTPDSRKRPWPTQKLRSRPMTKARPKRSRFQPMPKSDAENG